MLGNGIVTIRVADFGRAVRFYTETLGFPLRERHGERWAAVQAPGLVLGISPDPLPGGAAKPPGTLSIGFSVPSLETARAELERRGVTFSDQVNYGPVRLAFFTDPDGTPLYLSEEAPDGG